MKKSLSKLPLVLGALVFGLSFSAPALAMEKTQGTEDDSQEVSKVAEAHEQSDVSKPRVMKLETAKLKVCQHKEKQIDGTMARISDRGTKQINVFNKIAERVEAFYVKKGNTLPNYNDLVAAVNTKKAAAETAVAEVKASKAEFKCDGSDPHGAGSAFQANLKKEQTALKEYKTAVKNLIVGVKSVNGKTESAKPAAGGDQ